MKFRELSSKAQDRALLDHIDYLMTDMDLLSDDRNVFYPAVEKTKGNEPELAQVLFSDYRDQLIEDIEGKEFEFNKDGTSL